MKYKKTMLFVIGLVLLVICGIFGFKHFFNFDCEEKYTVVEILSKSGFMVKIKADACWEGTQAIYCIITKGESNVFPLSYIGSTLTKTDSLHFNLVEDDDLSIIAIVEQSNPDVILSVFDFKNNQFWPCHKNVSYQEERKIGLNLLNELQKAKSNKTFYLSSEINRESLKIH